MIKIRFCFFLLFVSFVSAQPIKHDFNHFILTGRNVLLAPLDWDTKDWMNFGGSVLLTAGAYAIDNNTEHLALTNRSSFNDALFKADDIITPLGVSVTAGFYIYGLAADDEKARMLGVHLGEAALYTEGIVFAMKTITGRSRPFLQKGKNYATAFTIEDGKTSFPSGHTSFAFAISTVMASYMDNLPWKISWYAAAGLVGAARIYHDKHWLSDVVFGAALGHFVASYIINKSEDKNKIELGVIPGGFYLRASL